MNAEFQSIAFYVCFLCIADILHGDFMPSVFVKPPLLYIYLYWSECIVQFFFKHCLKILIFAYNFQDENLKKPL